MEYKILDNGTAVVLTRHPEIAYDRLYIDFLGAPSGATAIFESGGVYLYRTLNDVTCSVPVDKLNGVVKVTVALLDGSTPLKRWACEELKAERLRDGGTLISPNDMNLPQRFVELELECESIRQTNKHIETRLKELEGRLDKLFEGYDLI